MDKASLVTDELDAGAAFIKQMNDYTPVMGACWLQTAEDGERYLYVVLDGLTERGAAYTEVLRIADAMTDHYIDPFRVKLIGPTDPIAKALTEIYRRFPARIPSRLNGSVFWGVGVAEVYMYPRPQKMP